MLSLLLSSVDLFPLYTLTLNAMNNNNDDDDDE